VGACTPKQTGENPPLGEKPPNDGIAYSFAFMGCNRVGYGDRFNWNATDSSTANLFALKRIYEDLAKEERKPDIFFFLGDLVLAESKHLNEMNTQLKHWVKLYRDTAFNKIANAGIELVALPGNHETLWYNKADRQEYPMKGSAAVWLKYMAPFMPSDRDTVTGDSSSVNRLTFAFKRENIGFVCMNTDTYNAPTHEHPLGYEGDIPSDWINSKVKEFRADPAIDHVFVLGHKPYYIKNEPETGHGGLFDGPEIWPTLEQERVVAMLSAHAHDYQRMQPGGKGTYQVIAGNGGSPPSPGAVPFFGYTTINIMTDGSIKLVTKGFDYDPLEYYKAIKGPTTVRDTTTMVWEGNPSPNFWEGMEQGE
jgi:hypothetical protein